MISLNNTFVFVHVNKTGGTSITEALSDYEDPLHPDYDHLCAKLAKRIIGADLWELGIVASFFTLSILLLNNRYKRFRYGKKKKDDNLNEVQMEEGLSYDADDAPYGHENTESD